MKISVQDYERVKADIGEVAQKLGIKISTSDAGKTGLKTMYALFYKTCEDRSYDDTHPNFVNGRWKRLLPFTGRKYCWLYDVGLNDTHIATALKNIKAELVALE